MTSPSEKLAASLAVLRVLQKDGRRVFTNKDLSRVHRERLLKNGFLQEVARGWLISSSPGTREGDSTPWYASFWEFCARYCDERFGIEWHLSAEQSLLLHAEKTVIPAQVIICSPKGANNKIALLFGTSLYDLKQARMPPLEDMSQRDGLRLFSPAAAMVRVPEIFFSSNAIETQVVLASFRDASDLLRRLLAGGHTTIAGRLAGAFRRIGRAEVADEIIGAMRAAGYDVRETDPFARRHSLVPVPATTAPIVGRMRAMWGLMREQVLEALPPLPGLPRNRRAYLKSIDDIYRSDAYHSLSIEGYKVTEELIERVKGGNWNPEKHEADRQSRDALAARGYWLAHQVVKRDIEAIIAGKSPGRLIRTTHREWYRELFQPCVGAGLIAAKELAGYRAEAVYLRTSRYVPPRWEAVRDAMPELFDLLQSEPEPGVRAVLGHWLLGYVHPYPDGNGRMARFLMNAMLASGGYPWTVIQMKDRADYLAALDRASIDMDIGPFAMFMAKRVKGSMERA